MRIYYVELFIYKGGVICKNNSIVDYVLFSEYFKCIYVCFFLRF